MSKEKNSANSYARSRKMRKIGIITASVSAGIVAIISLIAFLPRSNDGFTVHIDNPEKPSHFVMKDSLDGASTTHLSGTPLTNTWQTEAKKVEEKLSTYDAETLKGSQNLEEKVEALDGETKTTALVYTLYLENISTSEAQPFGYYVNLDGSNVKKGANSPLSYLRIMVQTSIIEGNDKSLNHDLKTTYYAMHNEKGEGTIVNDNDDRECISEFKFTANESGKKVREPVFTSPSHSDENNNGYCVNFNESDKIITVDKMEIPANKTMRFTFVAYLEGHDPESFTDVAVEANILMSLHFGL